MLLSGCQQRRVCAERRVRVSHGCDERQAQYLHRHRQVSVHSLSLHNLSSATCTFFASRRVLHVSKGDIFGVWESQWSYKYSELRSAPSMGDRGIEIFIKVACSNLVLAQTSAHENSNAVCVFTFFDLFCVKGQEKKLFSRQRVTGKLIPTENRAMGEFVCTKASEAMNRRMRNTNV